MRINERQRATLAAIAGWLGFGWAMIEFSGFLVNRYAAPEWIIDAALAAACAYLPVVVLASWWISEEGPMRWTLRRVALAAGLVLAGTALIPAALWLSGRGLDVGARTPSIVASPRIALFPFAVASDDPGDAWLGQALPLFSDVDLQFDARLAGSAANGSFAEPMRSVIQGLGVESIDAASPALRRQAARALGFQAMVGGQIRRDGPHLTATVDIDRFDPDAGLGPYEVTAGNVWDLVDRVSALIRAELAVADAAGASDPAMRTYTSHDESALRHYVDAVLSAVRDHDLQAAGEQIERAIAADPGFVLAELVSAELMFDRTEFERARSTMRRIEPRLGILPERSRFAAQERLARAFGDSAAQRNVYTLWASRFPHDPAPRLALARMDLLEEPHAERPWQLLLRVTMQAGSSDELLALSRSMLVREQLDRAQSLAELALARAPSNVDAWRQLAGVERGRGQHAEAHRRLQQAILLRPDFMPLHRDVAWLQFETGAWREAFATTRAARSRADGHGAYSASLLDIEISMLERLGRIEEANDRLDLLAAIESARLPPARLFSRFVGFSHLRAQVLGTERARTWIEQWAPYDGAGGRVYADALFDFVVSASVRDVDAYASAVTRMQALWPVSSPVAAERSLAPHKALAVAWLADDRASLAALDGALLTQQALHAAGGGVVESVDAFRLLVIDQALKLGRTKEGMRWLAPLLVRRPGDPVVRWRHAQLAEAMGDASVARDALAVVLEAWQGADDAFAPAAQARVLAARLGMDAERQPDWFE